MVRLAVAWSVQDDWSVQVWDEGVLAHTLPGLPSCTSATWAGQAWVRDHLVDAAEPLVEIRTSPEEAVVPWEASMGARLRTARAGAPVEPGSARILVEPYYPAWVRHGFFTAWWEHLAPSQALSAAYRRGECDWLEFAYAYLARFDADEDHPGRYLAWVRADVAALLQRYDSVTFIGVRPAPDGDERAVWCHRRLLVAWLRDDDISLGIGW